MIKALICFIFGFMFADLLNTWAERKKFDD